MRKTLLCAVLAVMPLLAAAEQPKLMIGDKDGAGAQLYGFARLDLIWNTRRFDHPQYPSVVTGTSDDTEVNIHPRLTRMGFRAWSGDLSAGWSVDGKIEIDFQNGGSESREAVRMRHAYLKVRGHGLSLLAGQTWDLISQLYPSVNADSMMWNVGNPGDRVPQLRLAYGAGVGRGKWEVAVAALMPAVTDKRDLDQNGLNDGRDDGLPHFQGRVGFEMPLWTNLPLKVAVGGLVRTSQATLAGQDARATGWGVFGELDLPLVTFGQGGKLGVKGEFFTGTDLAEVRAGIKNGAVIAASGDKVETVDTTGFWAELYAKPMSAVTLSAGYSQDDPTNEFLADGTPSKNRAFYGMVAWRPLPPLRLAVEYLNFKTDYKNAEARSAHRINTHFTWFF